MQFIKHFSNGRVKAEGSAIIKNGCITFRLPNNVEVVENGYIDGGIGFVVKPCEPRASAYTIVNTKIDPDYVPTELCASHYKFRITGKKISDTEYVFMYDKAVCLTHK